MTTLTQTTVSLQANTDIQAVIQAFSSSQDVLPTSRGLYTRTLGIFFDWVAATGRTINQLTVADIIEYKEQLLNGGKSSLTVASYINSIRRFYEWAEANKLYPNIARMVHAPKRKQQFRKQPLTVAQVGELLHYEKDTNSTRNYAIVNLMVRTGLRTIEVTRCNVGDITYMGGQRVLTIQGKGHTDKDSFVILTDAAYRPIREYLNTRKGAAPTEPLFTSTSNNNIGGRMTTRTISKIAKRGLVGVGLDSHVYTAHSLRHTTAVNILRGGGSIEQAQFTLRHTNPATTQIYTATLRDEQRLKNGGEKLLDAVYNTITV